jgi:hypothetical protein
MNGCRVHLLISVQDLILLVYYSDAWAWQFRVISGSEVFGERKIYYSAEAAEKAGRDWISSAG